MSNVSDFLPGAAGTHEVTVHTGNGHGSTNTKIRRFTTVLTNVGTDITYADSATLGASFTINKAGQYEVYYAELHSVNGTPFGASVNSAALTTSVDTIPIATRAIASTISTSTRATTATRTLRLAAGDVVRPHTSGAVDGATDATVFSIRKVGQ